MSESDLGGLLTAMATPFDGEGEVDFAAAAKLASYLLENGSDGLVVAGSTGEAATLDDTEQIDLLRAVRAEVGSCSSAAPEPTTPVIRST